jgi:hypothetical protein
VWAITEAGKRVPLDAEPVPDGNVLVIGERMGSPLVTVGTPPGLLEPPGTRYVAHFATCPDAGEWRRR